MKVRELQQQLAASTYLLPSQRDVISRLLFQLAFNDFTRIAVIGGPGSGKSTLALALAELFSNCQEMTVNLAMLQGPITDDQLVAQLGQQWFADAELGKASLHAKLDAGKVEPEYLLIVDDVGKLTASQYQWLMGLGIRLFCFGDTADPQLQLNLPLPALTLSDCEQLLAEEAYDPLVLAERFANSHGNLHKLLRHVDVTTDMASPPSRHVMRVPVIIGLILTSVTLAALLLTMLSDSKSDTGMPNVVSTKLVPLPPTSVLVEQAPVLSTEAASEAPLPSVRATVASDVKHDNLVNEPVVQPVTEPASAQPNAIIAPSTAESNSTTSEPAAMPDAVDARVPALSSTSDTDIITTPIGRKPQTEKSTALQPYDHTKILSLPQNQHVVQLAVLSSERALARFRRGYPELNVLVYQRRWQGKTQWVIVSGPHSNTSMAKQYIRNLPNALSASGPFVKTLSAVQQEIYAWQRLVDAESERGN